MAATEKKVYPVPRKLQKILLSLPADQVKMIDECGKAIGMSRSSFLQIYFDSYAEQVMAFTSGWLANIGYYYDKQKQENIVDEAKRSAEGLGAKMSKVRRQKE